MYFVTDGFDSGNRVIPLAPAIACTTLATSALPPEFAEAQQPTDDVAIIKRAKEGKNYFITNCRITRIERHRIYSPGAINTKNLFLNYAILDPKEHARESSVFVYDVDALSKGTGINCDDDFFFKQPNEKDLLTRRGDGPWLQQY